VKRDDRNLAKALGRSLILGLSVPNKCGGISPRTTRSKSKLCDESSGIKILVLGNSECCEANGKSVTVRNGFGIAFGLSGCS